MHRITVVTGSSSGDPPTPPSPLPHLDAVSDASSGDSPGSSPDHNSTQKPTKVSSWRKRGSRHLPPPYPDPIPLDLSMIKRRDLPIRLVVDEPVPVECYSDDPFAQTTSSSGVRRFSSRRQRSKENSSNKWHSSSAAKPSSSIQNSFANFDDAFRNSVSSESSWVAFDQSSKGETATSTTEKESPSDSGDSLHVFEDAAASYDKDTGVRRSKGPVLRMEYKGEMVSVSETTTARLQDLSWV
ncbi:expressed unknown protein [Seminavis robusta]|uniref:Uncharacterized protein n=1 Tax=Seminavis robusta TaxID=568900 RepID=A0A9N8H6R9_9STRA|nr:expressed unknown protein [Seminavis robusta]|eukprot:Sro156_g070650.1 n/a (241) ;mRNA; r:15866-16588